MAEEIKSLDVKSIVKEALSEMNITGGDFRHDEKATGGFKSVGEFAVSVKNALTPGFGQIDPRLMVKAPTAFAQGIVGADGGFAVPPVYKDEIWKAVNKVDALAVRCDQNPTSGDGIEMAADLTTPWSGSGIQAYWTGEGLAATQTKPLLNPRVIKLQTLTALVPATDQVINDAPRLSNLIMEKAPLAIKYLTDRAIVRGSGIGQPLGILNSAGRVTVTRDTSVTIKADDLQAMYSSMHPEYYDTCEWLVSNAAYAQLLNLSVGNFPSYGSSQTNGGMIGRPPYELYGRPVTVTQHCGAVGTEGDIILTSLKGYALVVKAGQDQIKFDSSIHLLFDYGMTAFRFVYRVGGQMYLAAPVTADNSGFNFSTAVTLSTK